MVNIAVIGNSEFALGFQLVGIREIISPSSQVIEDCKKLKKRSDLGIVIVDQSLMDTLHPHERIEIDNSIQPVFMSVSAEAEQGNLRELIKKSIGIDVWK